MAPINIPVPVEHLIAHVHVCFGSVNSIFQRQKLRERIPVNSATCLHLATLRKVPEIF